MLQHRWHTTHLFSQILIETFSHEFSKVFTTGYIDRSNLKATIRVTQACRAYLISKPPSKCPNVKIDRIAEAKRWTLAAIKKEWDNNSAKLTTLRRNICIMHVKEDISPSKNFVIGGREAQTLVVPHVIGLLLAPENLSSKPEASALPP